MTRPLSGAMAALLSTPAIAQSPPIRFARPELLDAAWGAANLATPNGRVVDMRPRGYAEGHVPGAVWLDNNDIRNRRSTRARRPRLRRPWLRRSR